MWLIICFLHYVCLILRTTNSHVKETSRSHAHSRDPDGGRGGGHKRHKVPSPVEEPSFMEEEEDEEEERGYHTNYSPSPPQQEQYRPQQQQNYHSDEYESPEPEPEPDPEPSPPQPSPPPRKEICHSKPSKESSGYHHRAEKKRDRDEERRRQQQGAPTDQGRVGGRREGPEGKKHSSDREQQSLTHKPSKHSKKSVVHDGKKDEKKRGDDGKCWFTFSCWRSISLKSVQSFWIFFCFCVGFWWHRHKVQDVNP